MPTTSRVSAGFRSSKVSPLADSTHSPSMKFLKTLDLGVPPSMTGLVRVSVAIKPPKDVTDDKCRTSMLTTAVKSGKARGW